MDELPLRVSVIRDSIRQIFRSAEASYNATLVPTVLGLETPRRLPDTLVLGRSPSPVRQGEIALGTRESGGGMRTQGLGARVTINV